ncbi:MAG TPA: M56 family metallopeptidase [Phnomibacter sp.]|nr:M56 family metallopeptidase [Phnomibacter sp.]
MLQLVQSSFLQALGLAIANSLWQMGLIWLLYQIINAIAKPTAGGRYALASAAALSGTLWFLLSCWYYWQTPVPFHSTVTFLSSQQQDGWLWRSISAIRLMIPYLGAAYLLVIAVLAVRFYNSFAQVHKLRHAGLSKAPVDWRLFVKKYNALLHIEKPVTLLLSTKVSSPMTLGFWKPIILLPIASINQLSAEQMEAVLLHELTHIRRHDYLVNMLLQVAEMLLFFNPFMRNLLRHAYNERENSCDDWVLQFNYNPREYATALLTLEQQAQKHALALCATGHKHQQFYLLQRIRRMVAPEKNAFNYRSQMGMLALLLAFGVLAHTIVDTRLAKTGSQSLATSKTLSPKVSSVPTEPFDLRATMTLFADIAQSIRTGNQQMQQAIASAKAMPPAGQHQETGMAIHDGLENASAFPAIGHPVIITELQAAENPVPAVVSAGNQTSILYAPKGKNEVAKSEVMIQGLDEASLLMLTTLAEQLAALEIEKHSLETAVGKAEIELRKVKVASVNARQYEKDGAWYTQQIDEYSTAAAMKKEAIKEWQQQMETARQQLQAMNDQSAAMLEKQLNSQQEAISKSLQDEIMLREKAIRELSKEIERISKPLGGQNNTEISGSAKLQPLNPAVKKPTRKPRVIIQL